MVGVLATPGGKRKAPGVLMLHGFPGAEHSVDVQRALLARGIASFRLHFQGAWGSEGNYLFSGLVDQAKAGLRFLARQPGVNSRRLGVFGFSMGGWTALNLAGAAPDILTAVAVAPVGGPEMVGPSNAPFIKSHCGPVRVASRDGLVRDFQDSVKRYDPVKAVAKSKADILLIHGTCDEVIPFEVSRRISATTGVRLVRAKGADHAFLDRRPWLTKRSVDWLSRRLLG